MRALEPVRMTVEEFLEWHMHQEERYELVDGVPLRMMTGALKGHNIVTSNIVMSLGPQMKMRGCSTMSNDMGVETSNGVRYPDVVVDCTPPASIDRVTRNPVLVVEVMSPSTRGMDLHDKLVEYRAIASIRLILLIESDVVAVNLHRREEGDVWTVERSHDLGATVEMRELGASLRVADIYDTLDPKIRALLREVPGDT